MLKSARLICFTVIASLMCSSVIIVGVAAHFGVPFPAWTRISKQTLWLEKRDRADFTMPSVKKVLDGTFQDGFESCLSDNVPGRDAALLVNAYLERLGIRTASKLFGFDVEHSFYGSDYLLVPDDGVAIAQSRKAPGPEADRDKYLDALNVAAQRYPDVGMAVEFVTEPSQTAGNPSCALLDSASRLTEDWIQAEMVDKLDPALHARVEGIGSYERYKSDWYHTDTHWTVKRAVQAYNSIAETLGLKLVEWREEDEIVAKDAWYGSVSRSARALEFSDSLVDQNRDFSNLRFYMLGNAAPGEEVQSGLRERFISGEITSSRIPPSGLNGTYFGGKNYEIENDGENNGKTCLIIGDSFIRPMFRYIADNYERTILVLPGNFKMEDTICGLLDKYEPDDMVVVMHCLKYRVIASKSPNILKSE